MKLSNTQLSVLKALMQVSAQKGNLANAGLAMEKGETLATAESWVVSATDATAHSERMLVETICRLKHTNFTPGLTMVSVIEPCLMCLSACSQAGYKELAYIIPAKRYVKPIPWMTDTVLVDKNKVAAQMSVPVKLVHLAEYEAEFSKIFEKAMHFLLAKKHE